jgi:hypothetical protein
MADWGRTPIISLLSIAGIAASGVIGIALGDFAVSGVDPTKAAAYAPDSGYDQLADTVKADRHMPAADTGMTSKVAYFRGDGTIFDQTTQSD